MSAPLAGTRVAWGRRPTGASRFYQPRRVAFWTLAVAFGAAAVLGVMQYWMTLVKPNGAYALLAMAAWVVWALISAWLVGLIDVYRHVPRSIRIAALAWGAFVTALLSGPVVGFVGNLVEPALGSYTSVVSSPLAEEAAKYLGVALIAGTVPVLFRRPMGGLICGMLAGLGFSYFENWGFTNGMLTEEMTQASASERYVAIAGFFWERGIFGGAWGHLVFTGLTCMGIVYFIRSQRSRTTRLLVAAAFFLGGVALHALNNFGTGVPEDLQAIVYGGAVLLQFIVLAVLIVYAIRADRAWLAGRDEGRIPQAVISDTELAGLRTRRTRRRARTAAPDQGTGKRLAELQNIQLATAEAIGDRAPEPEVSALTQAAEPLREAAGTVPAQARRTATQTPRDRAPGKERT